MAEQTKTLDYSVISRRRNDLFGIAIVSIVIFHFFLSCQKAHVHPVLANEYVALIGRVGVPIFLTLSGMGLFFSLSKNYNLKDFYKKRLVRVLIPYFIISVTHYFVRYILIEKLGFAAFLKGVFFIEFFTSKDSQFWFIALILIMYAIYPLLFKIFRSGKWNFIKLLVVIGLVICMNFLLYKYAKTTYNNISVMLTRIPAFIIGVYLGEKVYNKRAVSWQFWCITILGAAVYIFFSIQNEVLGTPPPSSMVFKYLETVYGLFLMMVISIVLEAIGSVTFSKMCAFFGAMSLELYMIHVSLRAMMGMKQIGFPSSNYIYYSIMVLLAVGLSFALSKFDAFATKKLTAGKK